MTNAEKLVQARAALHKLMTGTKAVSIRYADRSVQYSQANIEQLKLYIAELEELEGEAPTTRGQPFEVNWS